MSHSGQSSKDFPSENRSIDVETSDSEFDRTGDRDLKLGWKPVEPDSTKGTIVQASSLSDIASILANRWKNLPPDRKEAVYRKQLLKENEALRKEVADLKKMYNDRAQNNQRNQFASDQDFESNVGQLEKNTDLQAREYLQNLHISAADTKKLKRYIIKSLKTLAKVQAERDVYKTELASKKDELEQEVKTRVELQATVSDLRKVLDRLHGHTQHMVNNSGQKEQDFRIEVETLRVQLEETRRSLKSCERKKYLYEEQLRTLKESTSQTPRGAPSHILITQMDVVVRQVNEMVAKLKSQLVSADKSFQEQIAEMKQREQALLRQMKAAQKNLEDLRQDQDQKTQLMAQLAVRLRQIDQQNTHERQRLSQQYAAAQKRTQELELEIQDKETEWRLEQCKYTTTKSYLSRKVHDMAKTIASMNEEITDLEESNAALKEEISSLKRSSNASRERQLRALTKSVATNTKISYLDQAEYVGVVETPKKRRPRSRHGSTPNGAYSPARLPRSSSKITGIHTSRLPRASRSMSSFVSNTSEVSTSSNKPRWQF